MIIKSMGRKASGKMSGGGPGRGPFQNLVAYMTRAGVGETTRAVLWNGFYGHENMPREEIVRSFEDNAGLLKERKNGNVLYHEILSFSAGYRLQGEALVRAVADIGQEYLRHRAPDQLAFGAIHFDTEHIHLHLMISANEVGKAQRARLSKERFAEIQKTVEAFALAHYGELAQTHIYDRARSRERLKTQAHEQAMKARSGSPSRKETLKSKLHNLFELAASEAELGRLLDAEGLAFYTRGKSRGVIERLPDGSERRHRLTTLGLETHYRATMERFRIPAARGQAMAKEADMAKQKPVKEEIVREEPNPSAAKVVGHEFLTGEMHPAWHGESPPGKDGEVKVRYTDDILKNVREKEAERSKARATPGKDDSQER